MCETVEELSHTLEKAELIVKPKKEEKNKDGNEGIK